MEDERRAGGRRAAVRTLLSAIVVVTVVSMLATIAYAYTWSTRRAGQEATEGASYQAGLAGKALEKSLKDATTTIAGLSQTPSFADALRDPTNCTLNATGVASFSTAHLDLVRPDGTVACSSLARVGAPPGAHVGNPAWLQEALQADHPILSSVLTDPLTRREAIVLAAPLGPSAAPVGVVALVLRTDTVAGDLAAIYGGTNHLRFTIVDQNAVVVRSVSRVPAKVGRSVADSPFASQRSGTWPALDGAPLVFGSADVARLKWRIYAGVPEAVVIASARSTAAREMLVAVVALFAIAAMAFAVSRRIVRPLRQVTQAIVAARDEPLPSPVLVSGPREIATLASEFNAMLDARLDYEARLSNQALHDELTGLPNRGLLHDRLRSALQRIPPEGDTLVAVLFLDLDRFKNVNDTLGHPAGDALLREVATRLSADLRPGDTLARFGGDEFVVICDQIQDAAHAVAMAKRLAASLTDRFRIGDTQVTLAASIGIALAAEPDRDADDLIREADIAMYAAKGHGSGWELCDADLRSKHASRTQIEQDLRDALTRDEFFVEYQPIYRVATRTIIGAEALVRWRHPTKGRIPPMEFIAIAEETGDIQAIGQRVLTQACTDTAKLHRAGHTISVAVNVAVGQLTETFAPMVAEILRASGLPARDLHLEITESVLVRAFGPAADTLARLRGLGVNLAIDDFGTGYSSLSYLQHFPFDTLKIDRSFIDPLGRNTSAQALVHAMISMGDALSLHVVAEGVETEAQLECLTQLGCGYAQGFLLARPMPLQRFHALLATRDHATDNDDHAQPPVPAAFS